MVGEIKEGNKIEADLQNNFSQWDSACHVILCVTSEVSACGSFLWRLLASSGAPEKYHHHYYYHYYNHYYHHYYYYLIIRLDHLVGSQHH